MSPVVVHTLLALQHANDEQAEHLINSLAEPFLRRRVRAEWEALRASTVKQIGGAA